MITQEQFELFVKISAVLLLILIIAIGVSHAQQEKLKLKMQDEIERINKEPMPEDIWKGRKLLDSNGQEPIANIIYDEKGNIKAIKGMKK